MRPLISIVCLMSLCGLSLHTRAQQLERRRYVEVPRGEALISIAVQPDCPIQFENVRFLAGLGGGGGVDFRMRNVGSKPIRSVSYANWNTFGTGGYSGWPGKVTEEIVMPGQLVPLPAGDSQDEVVPLTEELRSNLKLDGSMKAIIVLMIRRVEYADGTVYTDETQAKKLSVLTEKIGALVDW